MESKMFHGYEVFEDGGIKKKDGSGFLRPAYTHKGYMHVGLYIGGRLRTMTVHKVVTLVFLGKRKEGYEVNHKNGKRDDNRLENLEYLTKSQNNQLSYDSGRRDVSGFKNANCKYSEKQIRGICEMLEKDSSLKARYISEYMGVAIMTVRSIMKRKQWDTVTKDYNY